MELNADGTIVTHVHLRRRIVELEKALDAHKLALLALTRALHRKDSKHEGTESDCGSDGELPTGAGSG
jgi:hypothetical protein